jgi:hypothetical protein
MKKSFIIYVLMIMVASILSSCAPRVTGPALVTVTGKIAGGNFVLDQDAFDANSVELTYNDPWLGDDLKYKGILLSKLVELVKPDHDATNIAIIGTDGKATVIPLAFGIRYNIMLAHWVNGTLMEIKNGGPVKIAFPDDAKGTDPVFDDENWAWWVVSIEFR